MARWIVLPYDESPAAQMALRRLARLTRTSVRGPLAIMLAVAGADPAGLPPLLAQARAVAGPDVSVEARLVAAADPGGALLRLAEDLPDAALAAPLGAAGNARWYAEAVRCALSGRRPVVYAFDVAPSLRPVRRWRLCTVRAAPDLVGFGRRVWAAIRHRNPRTDHSAQPQARSRSDRDAHAAPN